MIALLGPADFLGGGCIIGNPARIVTATATAMPVVEATLIEKKVMTRVLKDESWLGQTRNFVNFLMN